VIFIFPTINVKTFLCFYNILKKHVFMFFKFLKTVLNVFCLIFNVLFVVLIKT